MTSRQLRHLCHVAEIPEGSARGFPADGQGWPAVFLVRQAGGLKAWLDSCPHMPGSPLAWRRDAYLSGDGTEIVCYGHGARFHLETGECLSGPCFGQSLTSVHLELDPEDGVWMCGPAQGGQAD